MLLRAHISKFRSCTDVELDALGTITALVGRNGAGKSNVLRAVSWAARVATGAVSSSERSLYLADTGSVELEFELDDRRLVYRMKAELLREQKRPRMVISESLLEYEQDYLRVLIEKSPEGLRLFTNTSELATQQDNILADPTSSMLPALVTLKTLPNADLFRKVLDYLAGIRYYPLNELNREDNSDDARLVGSGEFVEWLNSNSHSRYGASDAVMRIVAMYLFHPERYEELITLLGPHGLGLISGISVRELKIAQPDQDNPIVVFGKTLSPYFALYFEQEHYGALSFSELSHGTRRVVDLLAAVLYDQSTLMLIEHPEDAVHIGLLNKLIDLLATYSTDVQVILATHSRAILNAMGIANIRFVDYVDGDTRVHRLKEDALERAERYITSEGPEGGSVADFVETFEHTLL
jgi:predicted ATPase